MMSYYTPYSALQDLLHHYNATKERNRQTAYDSLSRTAAYLSYLADRRTSGCPYRVQPLGSCTGFYNHEHLYPRIERE